MQINQEVKINKKDIFLNMHFRFSLEVCVKYTNEQTSQKCAASFGLCQNSYINYFILNVIKLIIWKHKINEW